VGIQFHCKRYLESLRSSCFCSPPLGGKVSTKTRVSIEPFLSITRPEGSPESHPTKGWPLISFLFLPETLGVFPPMGEEFAHCFLLFFHVKNWVLCFRFLLLQFFFPFFTIRFPVLEESDFPLTIDPSYSSFHFLLYIAVPVSGSIGLFEDFPLFRINPPPWSVMDQIARGCGGFFFPSFFGFAD